MDNNKVKKIMRDKIVSEGGVDRDWFDKHVTIILPEGGFDKDGNMDVSVEIDQHEDE